MSSPTNCRGRPPRALWARIHSNRCRYSSLFQSRSSLWKTSRMIRRMSPLPVSSHSLIRMPASQPASRARAVKPFSSARYRKTRCWSAKNGGSRAWPLPPPRSRHRRRPGPAAADPEGVHRFAGSQRGRRPGQLGDDRVGRVVAGPGGRRGKDRRQQDRQGGAAAAQEVGRGLYGLGLLTSAPGTAWSAHLRSARRANPALGRSGDVTERFRWCRPPDRAFSLHPTRNGSP